MEKGSPFNGGGYGCLKDLDAVCDRMTAADPDAIAAIKA